MKKLAFWASAILTGFALGVSALAAGALPTKSTKDNDHTLVGNERVALDFKPGYQEVFKKDTPTGRQNYLYTVTSFIDAFGRECTVTTGDSERSVSVDCDHPPNR